MEELANIPEMQPQLEDLKHHGPDGKNYWNSRELCGALGYSAYWKFSRVIDKAIAIATKKGMKIDDHFNQAVDMVRVGSGAYRKVETLHLSRMACLIIAQNADGKKPSVQTARQYFNDSADTLELIENTQTSNILLYKSPQGDTRIEVIFNSETFWMSQKRMATLFGVDVRTINYHLNQIYESGELSKTPTIRKIGIVQTEGDRDVDRTPLFYNLDAIIAVGYRVNSYQATQFRIWATSVLKEWKDRLEAFLATMDYNGTTISGSVFHDKAIEKAHKEYDKYKVIQDGTMVSDFDYYLSGYYGSDDELLSFNITYTP